MHEDKRLISIMGGLAVVGFVLLLGLAIGSSDDEGDGTLEGRKWVVRELIVEGSPGAPIEGTVLSATFAGGEVSGSAGCNNYFGSYDLDGDSLAIGPLASTERFCADPPDVMDQEQGYLSLLQAATRVEQSGDELTLIGDDFEIFFDGG